MGAWVPFGLEGSRQVSTCVLCPGQSTGDSTGIGSTRRGVGHGGWRLWQVMGCTEVPKGHPAAQRCRSGLKAEEMRDSTSGAGELTHPECL